MSKKKNRQHNHNNQVKSTPLVLRHIEPLTDTQGLAFDAYKKGQNLVLHGFAGTGKAQPLYCKVKVPSGWKTIGDLIVGDIISCPDGTSSRVLGIFPQGIKSVYEIEFYDGRKTRCCDEHLWKITSKASRKKYNTEEVVSLNYIRNVSYKNRRIGIPLISPEIRREADLEIHPYVLGVLLGDGGFTTQSVSITSADKELIDKVIEIGYKVEKRNSTKYAYGIHNIIDQLKKLNLFGLKSQYKFIPKDYLEYASYEQKIKLIQGLMDTDGTVDKGGSLSFSTSSDQLKDDVVYLIRSIGGIATTKLRKNVFYTYKGEKHRGLPSWNITIRHQNLKEFVSLPRKKSRIKGNQYGNTNLKIKKISYIGEEDCVCIMIEHPEHLYITDDFIVTHNTFLSLYLALNELLRDGTYYDKIIILRSVVPSRDMGFLPGNMKEKARVYEEPYMQICNELFGRPEYEALKARGSIVFSTTSYLRGITFNNAIIIVDEIQNMSLGELDTVMTRVGDNSKILFCGDFRQSDLKGVERKGLNDFLSVVKSMSQFEFIDFQAEDIVRSKLIRDYIINKTKLGF